MTEKNVFVVTVEDHWDADLALPDIISYLNAKIKPRGWQVSFCAKPLTDLQDALDSARADRDDKDDAIGIAVRDLGSPDPPPYGTRDLSEAVDRNVARIKELRGTVARLIELAYDNLNCDYCTDDPCEDENCTTHVEIPQLRAAANKEDFGAD